jgi:hypothetical protein
MRESHNPHEELFLAPSFVPISQLLFNQITAIRLVLMMARCWPAYCCHFILGGRLKVEGGNLNTFADFAPDLKLIIQQFCIFPVLG